MPLRPRRCADNSLTLPPGRGFPPSLLMKSAPAAVMAVFAADHIISPPDELLRCVTEASRIACENHVLVTFGAKPTYPSELYGYIRRGKPLPGANGSPPAFRIAEFREKPT